MAKNAPVRASALCSHGSKQTCATGATCTDLWQAALLAQIPDERGICGSLTADCSDASVASAYQTGKAYRDVASRSADAGSLCLLVRQLAFHGFVEETDVPSVAGGGGVKTVWYCATLASCMHFQHSGLTPSNGVCPVSTW